MPSKYLISLLLANAVAGCSTPYGDKLSIDYSRKQIGGSITVSDAKLYRREALINERRREMRYIDQLMANTEKDGFVIGPEIAREIEVIRSLAVSAGLSFDPAAGLANRGAERTASIRQDIDALQLQLQLDQLKRDATLFREKLATQTTPSRDTLGTPTQAGEAGTSNSLTPADTKELSDRIDTLQKALADRLGATSTAPRTVLLSGNPIDQFRDRAAYRQILTTARNAASLDELHDLDGAALYRLTFQVTTLPPRNEYRRTAGVVQMQPVASQPSEGEIKEIYLRWLGYINQTSLEAIGTPATGSVDSALLTSQLFSPVLFSYGTGTVVVPAAAAKQRGKTQAAQTTCVGLHSPERPVPANCMSVSFVAPILPASSISLVGQDRPLGKVVDEDFYRLENFYNEALTLLDQQPPIATMLLKPGLCELRSGGERSRIARGEPEGKVDTTLSAALSTLAAMPFLAEALDRLVASPVSPAFRTALFTERGRLARMAVRARGILEKLEETAGSLPGPPSCNRNTHLSASMDLIVPTRFRDLVARDTLVRVYEVGPREQVQQTSSAARAAEAFSLAAAVSAKASSAGVGAKAGLSYSRNAIGKVDMIERLPLVVGYAQAGIRAGAAPDAPSREPKFGWLLGPRVNAIDPRRGALDLRQGQKTYDLSADLSVSGWRTRLPIVVRTAWAPDWRSPAFAGAIDAAAPAQTETVEVQLNPSPSEFAALTQQLGFATAGRGQRLASITQVTPGKIKACMAATLVLQGDNLWRATDVIIGGRRMGPDALAVLPDMRGITIDIPAQMTFPNIVGQKVDMEVLTPYGVVHDKGRLEIDGYGAKGCDKPVASTPARQHAGIALASLGAVARDRNVGKD